MGLRGHFDFQRATAAKHSKGKDHFAATFGVPLDKFWDDVTGFDVVCFDDWLKVPDGKSTEGVVRERYGAAAVKLCRELL